MKRTANIHPWSPGCNPAVPAFFSVLVWDGDPCLFPDTSNAARFAFATSRAMLLCLDTAATVPATMPWQ